VDLPYKQVFIVVYWQGRLSRKFGPWVRKRLFAVYLPEELADVYMDSLQANVSDRLKDMSPDAKIVYQDNRHGDEMRLVLTISAWQQLEAELDRCTALVYLQVKNRAKEEGTA
jgi:hypothetical protein